MIVCVVLHYNRSNVSLSSFSRFIIKCWNYETKWKLTILVNVVFLSIILSFFFWKSRRTCEVLSNHISPFFYSFKIFLCDITILIIKVWIFLDIFENIIVLQLFVDSTLPSFSISFSLISLWIFKISFWIFLIKINFFLFLNISLLFLCSWKCCYWLVTF